VSILKLVKMSKKGRAQQAVFRALSDPTRRQILKLLRKGSRPAGEIADRFPLTKGSLSHHFNALKAADLVRTERRGQRIVYSLNTTVFQDVMAAFLELFDVPASADVAAGGKK